MRAQHLAVTAFMIAASLCTTASRAESVALLVPNEMATTAGFTAAMEAEMAALRQRLDAVEGRQVVEACGTSESVCPGLTVKLDYLNWALRRQGLDYAVTVDDTALAMGSGMVHNLEFDRDSGFRVALGYQMASGWELSFGYTYFHTSGAAATAEPAVGSLWAPRSHPARNLEASTATASGTFNYSVYDLEASYILLTDCSASLKMLGGLRWADIDQDLRLAYDGRDFDQGVISNPVQMNGFGIRLGLEGEWEFCRGWSLFGRGAGSVLYGDFSSRLLETNSAGVDTIVDVTDDYQQAVPVAEAALGIAWRHDWLELNVGYELTNWFNLGNRSMFIDDVNAGAYAPLANDILLDGWFVRGALLF